MTSDRLSNFPMARHRIIFRLPKLVQLDFTKVTSEEKVSDGNGEHTTWFVLRIMQCILSFSQVRSANCYLSSAGDLASRRSVFNKYIPDEEYFDYNPQLEDDELALSSDELSIGI